MIQLVPMTEQDFQDFYENLIREYAADKLKAGNYQPEDALQRSRKEIEEQLPDGLASNDQYLYSIVEDEAAQKVGILWVAAQRAKQMAFVYDVEIYEAFRRRGYAEQAFLRLEEKVKELGLTKIGLHVFGHNHAAQALYKKLGFEITNVHMAKTLD
ncbi:N-acetyltransferase [Reticulibacter mediterranei]|uniref:N-acetyltransferase n=1 Tax=Reticulibacter mediterranei TaxID=2778369 RepID=A0A8J3N714_9CHLR|nr:GNAT family N-acetyltransferase [Reticulibacter mediterranei]GHO98005.1 N-acetyltransferase [Reticulibacter mediterranei]